MKKLIAAFCMLTLAACASNQEYFGWTEADFKKPYSEDGKQFALFSKAEYECVESLLGMKAGKPKSHQINVNGWMPMVVTGLEPYHQRGSSATARFNFAYLEHRRIDASYDPVYRIIYLSHRATKATLAHEMAHDIMELAGYKGNHEVKAMWLEQNWGRCEATRIAPAVISSSPALMFSFPVGRPAGQG